MGVVIRYSGSVAEVSRVPKLLRDLSTLSSDMGWRCDWLDDMARNAPVPVDLRGVSLVVHSDCGRLQFHVTRDGQFVDLHLYGRAYVVMAVGSLTVERRALGISALQTLNEEEKRRIAVATADALRGDYLVRTLEVSTLKAGPEAHVGICHLLDYVKRHYAPNLEVFDDSGYFSHRDRGRLDAAMAWVDATLGHVQAVVEGVDEHPQNAGSGISTVDQMVRAIVASIVDVKTKLH